MKKIIIFMMMGLMVLGIVNAVTVITDNPSVSHSPLGNTLTTLSSLKIDSQSKNIDTRQFAVSYGFNSTTGYDGTGNNKDRVTLYSSIVAENGTGDVWVFNPLMKLLNNSNESYNYKAQVIELDLDNYVRHSGENLSKVTDEDGSRIGGMTLTGVGEFRNSYGISIESAQNNSIWNRGFVVNSANLASFVDYSNSNYSIYMAGNHIYGIYQINTSILNYFEGDSGFGTKTPTSKIDVYSDSDSGYYFRTRRGVNSIDLNMNSTENSIISAHKNFDIGTNSSNTVSLKVNNTRIITLHQSGEIRLFDKVDLNKIITAGTGFDRINGGSNYSEGLRINITNYEESPDNQGNTFIKGVDINLVNFGGDIKPFGIGINIDQHSNTTAPDASGIVLDMEILGTSNSTLKGVNIMLDDNNFTSTGLRGINTVITKHNSSTIAYGELIQSSGSQPVDYGVYMTGGAGFDTGFYFDAESANFQKGIDLVGYFSDRAIDVTQRANSTVMELNNLNQSTTLLINPDKTTLSNNYAGIYVINDAVPQTQAPIVRFRDARTDSTRPLLVLTQASPASPLLIETNGSVIPCDATNEGGVFYSSEDKTHYGCNSTDWNALY